MGESWYNGFDVRYRMSQGVVVNKAVKRGQMQAPSKCLACCQTEGIVMGHNEDYDFPHAYFPLCFVCHRIVHKRYERPELFLHYRTALRLGYRSTPFTSYAWRRWAKLYASDDPGTWPGTWGNELGDQTLLRMLPLMDSHEVPAGLRCSQGDPLIVGQYVPIDELWPLNVLTLKRSASTL